MYTHVGNAFPQALNCVSLPSYGVNQDDVFYLPCNHQNSKRISIQLQTKLIVTYLLMFLKLQSVCITPVAAFTTLGPILLTPGCAKLGSKDFPLLCKNHLGYISAGISSGATMTQDYINAKMKGDARLTSDLFPATATYMKWR